MNKAEVLALLQADNPQAPLASLEMYAGTFLDYQEAAGNVAENGTIVAHPRTGAPIENPYFRIKVAAMKSLLAFKRIKSDRLWQQAEAQAAKDSPK